MAYDTLLERRSKQMARHYAAESRGFDKIVRSFPSRLARDVWVAEHEHAYAITANQARTILGRRADRVRLYKWYLSGRSGL